MLKTEQEEVEMDHYDWGDERVVKKDWLPSCAGCIIKAFLGFLGLIVILFASMFIMDKEKEARHKKIIIRNSAIYIYNHYEDVHSLEYQEFRINSYGLGSDVYDVSITVNEDHEFELAMIWDFDIDGPDTEVVAYEVERADTAPESLLPKKAVPTSYKVLPDSVHFKDDTD